MKEAALQIEDLEAASPATSATVSTDMARGNCTGVAMRVVWGFVGSQNARFSSFVKGPCTVLTFVKHSLHLGAPRHLGHNPAGGAMIVLALSWQALSTERTWSRLCSPDANGRNERNIMEIKGVIVPMLAARRRR